MIDTFERNIAYFRQELRDLKTQHRHGIGMTRFYTAEMNISAQAGVVRTFRASVISGELTPAFITIYFNINPTADYITGTEATPDSRTLQIVLLNDASIKIKAVSTSRITLVEV